MSLLDDLKACLENTDDRSLVQIREEEPHYSVVIESAEYVPGKGTEVTSDGLTTFLADREVKVGDTVTYWDGNDSLMMGGYRYGWAHNGELVKWLTPFERVAERVQSLAESDRRQRERIESGAAERHSQYEGLPAPLKARIDRFVGERPDFWLNGDYELFCCIEAAKIVEYLRPKVDAGEDVETVVRAFHDLPWSEQKKAGMDDGHSGNTFSGACSLAMSLLRGDAV